MMELIIGVALGIVVGLSMFTVLTAVIMFNPKFMKWYTKQAMGYLNYFTEIDYDDLKNEVKESV